MHEHKQNQCKRKVKHRKYPLYTGEAGWICMECEKLYRLYERKI